MAHPLPGSTAVSCFGTIPDEQQRGLIEVEDEQVMQLYVELPPDVVVSSSIGRSVHCENA